MTVIFGKAIGSDELKIDSSIGRGGSAHQTCLFGKSEVDSPFTILLATISTENLSFAVLCAGVLHDQEVPITP